MTMLRPGGIIIRNEDFEKIKNPNFAKYVVEFSHDDFPVMCGVHYTMGSNSRNFLEARELNMKNLFLDQSIHNASLWRNYHFNPHIGDSDTIPTAPIVAAGNLGGLLICMEMEKISGDLNDPAQLLKTIHAAFESAGFTESFDASQSWTFSHEKDKSTSLFVTLSMGGYVSARCFPHLNYCGFDIALYNNFGKQYDAVENLVKSLGGNHDALSTFRVMTGASLSASGEDVAVSKKPLEYGKDDKCVEEDDVAASLAGNRTESTNLGEILDIVASQMTFASAPNKLVMGVLCGPESTVFCHSKNIYEIGPSCEKIPIYNCKDLPLGDVADPNLLFACEQELRMNVHEIVKKHGKFDGFLVDPTATSSLGKVLHKVLNNTQFRTQMMEETFLVMGPKVSGSESAEWLSTFLQLLRMEIVQINPAYHITLNVDTHDMGIFEIELFSSAEAAYDRVVRAIDLIKSRTGHSAYIKQGTSGVTGYDPAYEPSRIMLHSDYDTIDPRLQWTEQKPLYQQNIYQFVIGQPMAPLAVGEDVLFNSYVHFWFGTWVTGTITKVHTDGTYDVKVDRRQRTKQKRSLFRKVETDMSPLKVGDKILADSFDDEGEPCWLPGSIIEMLDDGRYLAQVFDKMGEDEVFEREKLMPFFEPPFHSKSDHALTFEELKATLSGIVDLFATRGQATVKSFDIKGDARIYTAAWDVGTVVGSWNGADRVDLSIKAAFDSPGFQKVASLMEDRITNIAVTSIDTFPRGTGRVLNTPKELKSFWFGEWNDRHENY